MFRIQIAQLDQIIGSEDTKIRKQSRDANLEMFEGRDRVNITALVVTNRAFFHFHFIKSPKADELKSDDNSGN